MTLNRKEEGRREEDFELGAGEKVMSSSCRHALIESCGEREDVRSQKETTCESFARQSPHLLHQVCLPWFQKRKIQSTSALGYIWFHSVYYIVSFSDVFYLFKIVCKHLIHVLQFKTYATGDHTLLFPPSLL